MKTPISIKNFLILPLLLGLLLLGTGRIQANQSSIDTAVSPASELAFSENGLTFNISAKDISIDANGAVVSSSLPVQINAPGQPSLPYYSTMVALPPLADVNVTVDAGQQQTITDAKVLPAKVEFDSVGFDPITGNEDERVDSIEPDNAIYSANSLYPSDLYTVSEPMYARDLRVVQITIFPVQYNPVSETLVYHPNMTVQVDFEGGSAELGSASTSDYSLANQVLNYTQAAGWHSAPATNASLTELPVGKNTYKIAVDADGIYELTYSDLQAAGMNVDTVNPNTLEMMYRGESVAYQFDGDGDNSFESNERVLFYGWAFDGTRHEKQYVTDNYFWIWANGSADTITSRANNTSGTLVDDFPESLTKEPEFAFFTTYSDEWDSFPNDPDSWWWDRMNKSSSGDQTFNYEVDVIDPLTTGTATYTAELMGTPWRFRANHEATLTMNGAGSTYINWPELDNVNAVGTLNQSSLINGVNQVDIRLETSGTDYVYLNRITVDYQRELKAVNNELIFSHDTNGDVRYRVDNFSSNNAANIIAWDISDKLQPEAVNIAAGQVGGSAGNYNYRIGTSATGSDAFIVTVENNVRSVLSIDKYLVRNLDPAGGADWVAITHESLTEQAERLEDHRSSYSKLDTHVVDYEDVMNQYAYGLPIPESIQEYMVHATSWSNAPSYLLLMGNATYNPRFLDCGSFCNANFNFEVNLIPTDLSFDDRKQGLIVSDHLFSTVIGSDLIPDLAVGRITADTADEAENVVDKILLYEANLHNAHANSDRYLFFADDIDDGGNFCGANNVTISNHVDTSAISSNEICLDDYLDNGQSSTDWKNDFFDEVSNTDGYSIVNYRGHGGIDHWAGRVIEVPDDNDSVKNAGKPFILLSADCLDGNFGWVGTKSISEAWMTRGGTQGSAAHWSSSGLGFSFEHNVLHRGFYDAVFDLNKLRIGDATTFAKDNYLTTTNYSTAEVLSFNLQGDPAMPVRRIATDSGTIRIVSTSAYDAKSGGAGGAVNYSVTVTNSGTVADSYDISFSGNSWVVGLSSTTVGPLNPGQSATVTVSVTISAGAQVNDVDEVYVEATSQADSGISSETLLTTTADNSVPASISLASNSAETSNNAIAYILVFFVALFGTAIVIGRKNQKSID